MLDSVAPSDSAVPSDSLVPTTPVVKKPVVMDKTKAQKFFDNFPKDKIVSYKEYWETVKPKNTDDIFRRYLFAFCSVHTTWEGNVRGYNAIKNFNEWTDNKESLKEKLHKSGVGLHNNRTEYIWSFKDKFLLIQKIFI